MILTLRCECDLRDMRLEGAFEPVGTARPPREAVSTGVCVIIQLGFGCNPTGPVHGCLDPPSRPLGVRGSVETDPPAALASSGGDGQAMRCVSEVLTEKPHPCFSLKDPRQTESSSCAQRLRHRSVLIPSHPE